MAKPAFINGFRPITEYAQPIFKLHPKKLRFSISFALIILSFFFAIWQIRIWGGVSSPLVFIFGIVEQPTFPYYPGSFLIAYLSSVLVGGLLFYLLLLVSPKRKKACLN